MTQPYYQDDWVSLYHAAAGAPQRAGQGRVAMSALRLAEFLGCRLLRHAHDLGDPVHRHTGGLSCAHRLASVGHCVGQADASIVDALLGREETLPFAHAQWPIRAARKMPVSVWIAGVGASISRCPQVPHVRTMVAGFMVCGFVLIPTTIHNHGCVVKWTREGKS